MIETILGLMLIVQVVFAVEMIRNLRKHDKLIEEEKKTEADHKERLHQAQPGDTLEALDRSSTEDIARALFEAQRLALKIRGKYEH